MYIFFIIESNALVGKIQCANIIGFAPNPNKYLVFGCFLFTAFEIFFATTVGLVNNFKFPPYIYLYTLETFTQISS